MSVGRHYVSKGHLIYSWPSQKVLGIHDSTTLVIATPLLHMDLLSTLAPSAQTIHALLTDENISDSVKSSSVTRAVLRSATSGDTDLLEYLLSSASQYADLDAVDPDGSPALVLAACFGFGDAVRLLVEAKANLEARDIRGWTALHWFVSCHAAIICKLNFLVASGPLKTGTFQQPAIY